MRRGHTWFMSLASLALLLGMAGCYPIPAASAPRYRVAGLAPGDKVTIDDSTDDVTIDVSSEKGIGSAEITRLGPPPKSLTVNFHLKGLEEASLGWAGVQVTAHVSSSNGSVSEEVQLAGSPASAIDGTSPYWMPVRIEAADKTIPLKDGLFAVAAPPAFIQAAPDRFTLKWIDFYR